MRAIYINLLMWQKANQLCLRLHKVTNLLPSRERLFLSAKIRTSSEQIPLSIAEGSSCEYIRDFIKRLRIAYRLLIKVKTEVLIIRHLDYISYDLHNMMDGEIEELIELIQQMIRTLEVQKDALHPAFAYLGPPYICN